MSSQTLPCPPLALRCASHAVLIFLLCVVGSEEKAGEGEGEGKRKCARSNKELWRDFRLHCAHINCLIMR